MSEVIDDLESVASDLGGPVVELLQALHNEPAYDVRLLKIQIQVRFREKKVGGLNSKLHHFYISKVFARKHGSSELLKRHGFEWTVHNSDHQYWKLEGLHHHESFKTVIEKMTGVPISV